MPTLFARGLRPRNFLLPDFATREETGRDLAKIIYTNFFVIFYVIPIENIKHFIKLTQFESRDKIARYCEKRVIILAQILLSRMIKTQSTTQNVVFPCP